MRIQITVYNTLVAEAVVENYEEAEKIWHKWCALRYSRNEPMGGACIGMGARMWDVPVGSEVSSERPH